MCTSPWGYMKILVMVEITKMANKVKNVTNDNVICMGLKYGCDKITNEKLCLHYLVE